LHGRAGKHGLRVAAVDAGSLGEQVGLRPGDIILAVDGVPTPDELDFRFRSSEASFQLTYQRGGITQTIEVWNEAEQPLGIAFEDPLGDGIHICNNRCVFCFIHQMPPRMRKSLYIRDDDYRLSFVHGNYITLTNLSQEELARIVNQRLSPLYVSVHSTDPNVRGMLLGRQHAVPVLDRLQWLGENGIDTHTQVVLCPGLNDGWVLDETIRALARLHPESTGLRHGVRSVAVVPVGLTRFRDRLPTLRAPDRAYAEKLVGWLRRRTASMKRQLGTRFVWLSDEWYFLAGRHVPSRSHYEGFPQLEDGVGTTRLFLDDLQRVARSIPAVVEPARNVLLVTGELAADAVGRMASMLNAVAGLHVDIIVVRNDWFGGTISAAGLLTGRDIGAALAGANRDATVYLPDVCLREKSGVLLDDMTVEDLRAKTGLRIEVTAPYPSALAAHLGLTPAKQMG